jgi:hypothetical protein
MCRGMLNPLYEPVLTNMGNGLLVLGGFERLSQGGDVVAVVQ